MKCGNDDEISKFEETVYSDPKMKWQYEERRMAMNDEMKWLTGVAWNIFEETRNEISTA